jgi:hypothetical protein
LAKGWNEFVSVNWEARSVVRYRNDPGKKMRGVLSVPGQELWEDLFELLSKWKGE